MQTRWLAGLLACALAGAAVAAGPVRAADLGGAPVRPPRDFAPPYYEQRSEFERWTGLYVGGTLGYAFGDARARGDIGNFPFEQEGAVGTIFAGYNWQIGRTVLGVEADIGTGGFGAEKVTPFGTLQTEVNAIGSFRARAGLLLSPALLVYGTAGLAWANMDIGFAGLTHQSETFFGWQIGTGAELMVSRNVTLRLEYLFTDLEKSGVVHSGQTNGYDMEFHTVRAGVSFKF